MEGGAADLHRCSPDGTGHRPQATLQDHGWELRHRPGQTLEVLGLTCVRPLSTGRSGGPRRRREEGKAPPPGSPPPRAGRWLSALSSFTGGERRRGRPWERSECASPATSDPDP